MVAVGDQRRAVESLSAPQTHVGRRLVAEKADHPGEREDHEVRELVGVDEPLDRLPERNACADEDRRDHEIPGTLLRGQ